MKNQKQNGFILPIIIILAIIIAIAVYYGSKLVSQKTILYIYNEGKVKAKEIRLKAFRFGYQPQLFDYFYYLKN